MCNYCDELLTKYPGARIRECPVVAQARRQLVTHDVLHQSLPGAKPSARVFIHPRCLSGPAWGALQASLEERGIDSDNAMIGPPSDQGYCELVRQIKREGSVATLERFDRSQFEYECSKTENTSPDGGRAA